MLLTLFDVSKAIADELADYEVQLFDNAMGPSTLRAELEEGSGVLLEQQATGETVGYALVRRQGPVVDITRLAILPGHQGKGYGTFLLRRLLRQYPAESYMLNVKKNNKKALRLYRREGFKITGTIGESWLMVKTREG